MPRSLGLQVLVGTKRSAASIAAVRRARLTVGQLVTVVAIPGVLVGDRAAFARQLHQRLLVVAISSRPDTPSPNPFGSALHPVKRSGAFVHSRSLMRRPDPPHRGS
jgi:hypothetical protein